MINTIFDMFKGISIYFDGRATSYNVVGCRFLTLLLLNGLGRHGYWVAVPVELFPERHMRWFAQYTGVGSQLKVQIVSELIFDASSPLIFDLTFSVDFLLSRDVLVHVSWGSFELSRLFHHVSRYSALAVEIDSC